MTRHPVDSPSGFSLTELLMALVIMALLISLATPGWRDHIRSARRSEAISDLLHAAARQEQFRLTNHRYANTSELALAPPDGLGLAANSGSYVLTSAITNAGYLMAATVNADGLQKDDARCWTFTLDQTGLQQARDIDNRDTTSNCWRNR